MNVSMAIMVADNHAPKFSETLEEDFWKIIA